MFSRSTLFASIAPFLLALTGCSGAPVPRGAIEPVDGGRADADQPLDGGFADVDHPVDGGLVDSQDHVFFVVDTRYERQIAGCVPTPPVNCTQYGKFGKDGTAFVLLTDEANGGNYEIKDGKILVSFWTSADGGKSMTFSLSADRKTAVNDADGHTWLLVAP